MTEPPFIVNVIVRNPGQVTQAIRARLNAAIDKSLREVGELVVLEARARVSIDQRDAYKSLRSEVNGRTVRIYADPTVAPHAGWLERGTKPRAAPLLFGLGEKPRAVPRLLGWVERKWNLSGRAAERAAYRLALKIKISGTKAHPFLVPALRESRPKILDIFRRNLGRA